MDGWTGYSNVTILFQNSLSTHSKIFGCAYHFFFIYYENDFCMEEMEPILCRTAKKNTLVINVGVNTQYTGKCFSF